MNDAIVTMQEAFAGFMGEATKRLALFLEEVLPSVSDDWWNQAVLDSLSYYQRRRIDAAKTKSLTSLDLAGLLRVFDKNWYEISLKLNLGSEHRHFVKEMQTVRNRWAHAGIDGFPDDDIYRDLDTLQRFAVLIGAEEVFVEKVRTTKREVMDRGHDGPDQYLTAHSRETAGKERGPFEAGQVVFVKSNPSIRGAVVAVLSGKPEDRIKVFVDGSIQSYYASQLEIENKQLDNWENLNCDGFHSYLTALQIRHPGLSTLYSLNAARVDFIPYQFRPVLRFIRSDRPRLLIADGVGVGKTIEAGLILRELQARRDVRSILVICPRPLVTERKWQSEMKRFEERFSHLDGAALRFCINEMDLEGVWPEQYQKAIIPYSLFDEALLYGSEPGGKGKRKNGLLDLDPPPRFDLVIVDEAHHIRNQDTFSHKAVRFFCDHAEAVVFLTATPIQLGSHDLFVLLNALRPDLVIDEESYEHMAEPNPFINQAVTLVRGQESEWRVRAIDALDEAAATAWGQSILRHNPSFIRTRSRLTEGEVGSEERVQLITDIEALHTFAGIINRTRRRDIGDFTIRKPETIMIPMTQEQQDLHDELLRLQAEILSRLHEDTNIKFMMTTIRRQAASCLHGLAPLLDDILNRHIDELSWEEADNTETPHPEDVTAIQSQIQTILERARSLNSHDPKLETLRDIVRDKQNLPNNKIMLFSSFRHTLQYLYDHLAGDGFRVGMVHGGTPDDDRVEFRNRFQKPREDSDCLDVLLFSEIGCEGLDYQFCDCILNYDLPWNPMRIEQRIGRIDRNGQKSESVAVINLITPGTIDADIYERCLVRIGVFNNALGGGEEILGEITKEIRSIAENYTLSEEQRRAKLQQLADNSIRLIQEQEELEQRQVELFGIRLPEGQMKKEIENASSFWLSSESIQRLVKLYLQHRCGREQEFILGERSLKTLRLSQDSRGFILHDLQQLSRQNTTAYREWENWLKGADQHLLVTFEAECAMQHAEAAFVTPVHPLAKQAAMTFNAGKRVITSLKAESALVPEGRYEFAIYQWRFHGIREDLVLCPIGSTEAIRTSLANLLSTAVDASEDMTRSIDSSVWDELDAHHYQIWTSERGKHQQRNRELVEYRRESLSTSHKARIALLKEQLEQATDERIQKMRQSQIAAAEVDYARRVQDLDIAMERADIAAEPVAYGIIDVVKEISDAV